MNSCTSWVVYVNDKNSLYKRPKGLNCHLIALQCKWITEVLMHFHDLLPMLLSNEDCRHDLLALSYNKTICILNGHLWLMRLRENSYKFPKCSHIHVFITHGGSNTCKTTWASRKCMVGLYMCMRYGSTNFKIFNDKFN